MLERFTRALEKNKDDLDYHTYWRYTKAGRMPKVITWLARHPDLAKALAEDASEMKKAEKKERKLTK